MRHPPNLSPGEVANLLRLVAYADEQSAAAPFDWLRGYLACAAREPVHVPLDPRREPEPTNGLGLATVGRVQVERRRT